jgi:hypothetical protein
LAWSVTGVVLVVALFLREGTPPANRAEAPNVVVEQPQARTQALPTVERPQGRAQFTTPATPSQTVEQRRASTAVAPSAPSTLTVIVENIEVPEDAVTIEPVQIEPLWPNPLEPELMESPMPLRAEWVELEPIVIE